MHVGFNYLVVDGLANGTEYAFSVTAVYADGRRSDSVSVKAVPHVGPWPEEGVNGTYINNGIVQLGVDMDRGGAVFHFSEVNTKRNLLNHADEGRFIQQSYYGEADGSDWNGQSWVWNPIQGGGCRGEKARVISQEITENSIRVVSTPVHWATGEAVTDCEMEERITLDGRIARIHYTFRNTGPGATDHPATSQEMPAVFVDYALKNLVYYDGSSPWTGGPLRRDVPGWPNEERTRTEHWAAYVDDSDWGIGVYTPGTPLSTTYRFDGPSGPTGGGCSYFAPIRNFAVAKGLVLEYDVYLYIGTVEEIRSAFDAIRTDGWEIDDSGFPEGYLYVKESSGVAVEEARIVAVGGLHLPLDRDKRRGVGDYAAHSCRYTRSGADLHVQERSGRASFGRSRRRFADSGPDRAADRFFRLAPLRIRYGAGGRAVRMGQYRLAHAAVAGRRCRCRVGDKAVAYAGAKRPWKRSWLRLCSSSCRSPGPISNGSRI